MRHYGHFDKFGKLQCESFRRELQGFKERGVHVVLTVEEFREKRSNQANRYYWGICVDLIARGLKDAGWEPRECSAEQVHELLKREFLTEDRHINGVIVKRTKSTTELDTQQFGEYIEHCVRFAAENLDVIIPPPGEQLELAA